MKNWLWSRSCRHLLDIVYPSMLDEMGSLDMHHAVIKQAHGCA